MDDMVEKSAPGWPQLLADGAPWALAAGGDPHRAGRGPGGAGWRQRGGDPWHGHRPWAERVASRPRMAKIDGKNDGNR